MIRNTSKFEQNCHQTKSRSRNTTCQIAGGCALTSYYQDSTTINKKRSFRHNVIWRTTSYRGVVPSTSSTSVGMKRAWSYIKLLRAKSMAIPALFWKYRVCANAMSKAEALSEQYESVFKKEDLNNVPILPESPYGDIPDITFCFPDIQIESIRPEKACGPDQNPSYVLKESTFELAPIFASFFRQSFDEGALPSAWRDANIIAIFKKGHSADFKSYRSVSLRSLIAWHRTRYLQANFAAILVEFSHLPAPARLPKRTFNLCETQPIATIPEWASIVNIRGQVDVIFLDFAKAFDTVTHESKDSSLRPDFMASLKN